MQPEVTLWRAVLAQAIADATMPRFSGDDFKTARRARDHARDWLIKDSKDFRNVCDMAQLEADAVRARMVTMALSGWEREPGRSERRYHGRKRVA